MKVLGVLGVVGMLLSGTLAHAGCQTPEEVLESLLESRRQLVATGASAEALAEQDATIDAHAGQKDAVWSGLYWYRDLAQAKQRAAEVGKPILSLRLLGRLDCELSCANSRFFRTVLYANAELSAWLKERFVLHWESVRPVPVVSIDFGDGRVLRRTLTGNSIHYVLTRDGQVLDALPGLYGPRRFQAQLQAALRAAAALDSAPDPEAARRTHQAARLAQLERERRLAQVDPRDVFQPVEPPDGRRPTAAEAAPRAMGKMIVEAPLVRATTGQDPVDPAGLGPALGDVSLDAGSRSLMRTKLPPERRDGLAFEAVVADFQAVVARDQAQNELDLRPRILRKLLEAPVDVHALNRWVYAEVFLTPDADPWLGLDAGGAYAALEDGGILEGAPLDD